MLQKPIEPIFWYVVQDGRQLATFKTMIKGAKLQFQLPEHMIDRGYRRKNIGILVSRNEEHEGLSLSIDIGKGIANEFRTSKKFERDHICVR